MGINDMILKFGMYISFIDFFIVIMEMISSNQKCLNETLNNVCFSYIVYLDDS
jgi:hypothetical protein